MGRDGKPTYLVQIRLTGKPSVAKTFERRTDAKEWAAKTEAEMRRSRALGGVRIAVTHYPLYGRALAATGDYAAVFSGHTHEVRQERLGDCLWLNPGEVMGWKGPATCAVYDTATRQAEIVTLG